MIGMSLYFNEILMSYRKQRIILKEDGKNSYSCTIAGKLYEIKHTH